MYRYDQPPLKLSIWQQNLNNSLIAQQSLLNGPLIQRWNLYALQEPHVNRTGNTYCPHNYYPVYPSTRFTDEASKYRSVILISKSINTNHWKQIPFPSRDVVVLQLSGPFGLCTLFNIYNDCKHDQTINALSSFINTERNVLFQHVHDHMVWLGDFNRHHPLWESERNTHLMQTSHIRKAQPLIDLIADHSMFMPLPKDLPTLQALNSKNWTRVDNVFCTDHTAELFTVCKTEPGQRGPLTDHVPILSQLELIVPETEEAVAYNFRDVKWTEFSEVLKAKLQTVDTKERITSVNQFQQTCDILMAAIQDTVQEKVPRTRPSPNSKRWWTRELTQLKDELAKLARDSFELKDDNRHSIHNQYRKSRNRYAHVLKTTKKQHWTDWLEDISGDDIWVANKYISNVNNTGANTRIPSLKRAVPVNGSFLAATNDEKSRLLANTFFPPPPADSSVPADFNYPNPVPSNTIVTKEALIRAIAKLSPYKAPGPDGICNIVFKECVDILAPHLTRIFQAVFDLNTTYDPWKEFTTVVLRKPGRPDYTLPKAYRPIALLNTTYKLLSAVVANHLSELLEKHNLLPATHFGGRPGRSTTDSLHLLEATIKQAWRNRQVVSVLFLDIEGAFPNAVTDRLLHNMRSRKVPEQIVLFVQSALANRRTKLKFDGYQSEVWLPINNGIGQGDPLSMVLYTIYNAGLLDICNDRDKKERAQAFVDDTMLLAIGKTFEETHATLKDMMERSGGGYEWATSHNSKFETSKFALLDFCTQAKRERPDLELQGITIKPKSQHKFLGVIIDQTLKWTAQTAYAIAKGTAYVLQLKRLSSTSFGIPVSLMKRIYLAVAIPKMLYAIDVWIRPIYTNESEFHTPGSKGAIRKLNSVQRLAMLSITGAMRTSPTDSLEILSNMWPMAHRIQNLCHQATIRLATVADSHPLHSYVKRASGRFVKKHRSSLHYLFHAYEIDPKAIEPLTRNKVTLHANPPYRTHIASNAEQAIEDLEQITRDGQTIVYSDGSGTGTGIGAAAVRLRSNAAPQALKYHLGKPSDHTVYEAEAVGLTLAAKLLLSMNRGRIDHGVSIMVDNQAAIRSGESPTTKPGHYILHYLHRIIRDVRRKHNLDKNQITIRWIPGHAGVPGNEQADEKAREAAASATNNSPPRSLPNYIRTNPLPSSVTALKQAHRETSKLRWTKTWSESARFKRMSRYKMDKPSNAFLKLISPLSKKQAALLTGLRTGHLPLNEHLHRINRADSPECPHCPGVVESVNHLILHCPQYARERQVLRNKMRRDADNIPTLLTQEKGIAALMSFIEATGRLKPTYGDVTAQKKSNK